MLNFNKMLKGPAPRPVEPQELFHSLQHEGEIQYLRDVQKDVLDAWFVRRLNEQDFIIKMNTGAGKTLVGLLMLQSGLNEKIGASLYLCPNKQLVAQVITQATAYGLETVTTEGGSLPVEFTNGDRILVATFQAFFNGMSRFGVIGGRHAPVELGSILIDDAHTCVASAREQVSLSFASDHDAYSKLFSLFQAALEQQNRPVATEIANGTTYASMAVPHWAWMSRISDVSTIIGDSKNEDAVKFAWPLILDTLELSQCVVSASSIDIYPYAVPTQRIPSFAMAKRRYFLSATLVDDSVLVRDFAVASKAAQTPISPKVSGDVGQRMILVPLTCLRNFGPVEA